MFYIEELTGYGKDDVRGWGLRDGYPSRKDAVEDLLAHRAELDKSDRRFRVTEEGR